MNKVGRSFRNSFRGLKKAYKKDLSFQLEVWAGLALCAVGYYFWPLLNLELVLLVFSYFFVLSTELLNTSIEEALGHLHPESHERIGTSKDIASAAVLMAVLFSVFSVLLIAYNHLLA